MMKLKTLSGAIIFGILTLSTAANSYQDADVLVKEVKSNDWVIVKDAKNKLENNPHVALPHLFAVLAENEYIPLTNTGDLIYPGAKKFYGHGQIVNYDIDHLAIRIGWIIEQITFQNFGFSQVHDKEEKIMEHVKNHFDNYLDKNSYARLANSSVEVQREEMLKLSIKKAKDWYKANSSGWNRLSALKDALESNDPKRQANALHYLRKGETKCKGLNKKTYNSELLPHVKKLTSSNSPRVAEQAKYLMKDDELEFLSIKGN
jgi:hypothetical protein